MPIDKSQKTKNVKNYKDGIQELEQDWYPNKPGMEVDARLKRLTKVTNTRQQTLIMNSMTDKNKELPQPNFTTVYAYKKKVWQVVGHRCLNCGKVMSDENIMAKHPLICTNSLKINKEDAYNSQLEVDDEGELTMPIQRVMKGETPYYRYGTHGKLYRTKQEAEAQMRAMYAGGYKKKEDKK